MPIHLQDFFQFRWGTFTKSTTLHQESQSASEEQRVGAGNIENSCSTSNPFSRLFPVQFEILLGEWTQNLQKDLLRAWWTHPGIILGLDSEDSTQQGLAGAVPSLAGILALRLPRLQELSILSRADFPSCKRRLRTPPPRPVPTTGTHPQHCSSSLDFLDFCFLFSFSC